MIKKLTFVLVAILTTQWTFSQEKETEDIPLSYVMVTPIYPSCEDETNNYFRKSCFSKKINEHFFEYFDVRKATKKTKLKPGKYKIYISFVVNTEGKITKIKTSAPHKNIEKEARRVMSFLPKITPGKINGLPSDVPFSLPVLFEITR